MLISCTKRPIPVDEEGRQNDAVIADIEQMVYLRGTGAVVAGTRGEQRRWRRLTAPLNAVLVGR